MKIINNKLKLDINVSKAKQVLSDKSENKEYVYLKINFPNENILSLLRQ